MRKWYRLALCMPVALSLCAWFATHAGSSADPLVTLSYINKTFIPQVITQSLATAESGWKNQVAALSQQLQAKQNAALGQASAGQVMQSMPENSRTARATRFTPVTLQKGDTMTGGVGTGFILVSGTAVVSGTAGRVLLNLRAGVEVAVGADVRLNDRYMLPARDGTGITITSGTATLLVDGVHTVQPAYAPLYKSQADTLFQLGLFRGTNIGYELERPATRLEALIMLVRLLGEEQAALAHDPTHPFPDVPQWADRQADRYVAYAYEKGYTKGVLRTGTGQLVFDSTVPVTADQFATFALRALGYDDTAGDFAWDKAVDKTVSLGMLTASQGASFRMRFYRDQTVYLAYQTLYTTEKGGSRTLYDKLRALGVLP